jgi:hypothetical protein
VGSFSRVSETYRDFIRAKPSVPLCRSELLGERVCGTQGVFLGGSERPKGFRDCLNHIKQLIETVLGLWDPGGFLAGSERPIEILLGPNHPNGFPGVNYSIIQVCGTQWVFLGGSERPRVTLRRVRETQGVPRRSKAH